MANKEKVIPMDTNVVDTLESLTAKVKEVREAQKIFATYTQEQVDKIFFAAATAAGQSQACCSRRDGAARQERAARQSCFQRLFHWFPSISVSGQEAPNVRACLRTRTTAVPIIRENPQKIKNL